MQPFVSALLPNIVGTGGSFQKLIISMAFYLWSQLHRTIILNLGKKKMQQLKSSSMDYERKMAILVTAWFESFPLFVQIMRKYLSCLSHFWTQMYPYFGTWHNFDFADLWQFFVFHGLVYCNQEKKRHMSFNFQT